MPDYNGSGGQGYRPKDSYRNETPEIRNEQPATGKTIEQTIKELMIERLFLKIKPEDISDETLLMEQLGIDSVSVFEIVVGLEETFGISFEDEEFKIEYYRTPNSIADQVRRKLAEKQKEPIS